MSDMTVELQRQEQERVRQQQIEERYLIACEETRKRWPELIAAGRARTPRWLFLVWGLLYTLLTIALSFYSLTNLMSATWILGSLMTLIVVLLPPLNGLNWYFCRPHKFPDWPSRDDPLVQIPKFDIASGCLPYYFVNACGGLFGLLVLFERSFFTGESVRNNCIDGLGTYLGTTVCTLIVLGLGGYFLSHKLVALQNWLKKYVYFLVALGLGICTTLATAGWKARYAENYTEAVWINLKEYSVLILTWIGYLFSYCMIAVIVLLPVCFGILILSEGLEGMKGRRVGTKLGWRRYDRLAALVVIGLVLLGAFLVLRSVTAGNSGS